MKDLYIAAHEELIEQYLLDHPDSTWSEAYKATEDDVDELMRDKYASMIDAARDRAKDEK